LKHPEGGHLHGEDLFLVSLWQFGLVVSKHKHVAACRVTVEVAEEEDVSAFQGPLHHKLSVVVDRVELARRSNPLPIQVLTHQRAAVIAHDHSVWIQHGHDFEYESVSQKLRLVIVTNQEVNHPVHDERCVAFARMHPRRKDYGFAHSDVDRIAREVGDDEHVDVVAGEGLAEDGLADLVFVGEGADFVDEVTLVRVRVRVAVGEKYSVVVV